MLSQMQLLFFKCLISQCVIPTFPCFFGMSPYLRASSVRLFPFLPTRLASGVWGAESTSPDPILLSLAEARLPVAILVADMISCSCFCRFSLMNRDSEIPLGERKEYVNLKTAIVSCGRCLVEQSE